MYYNNSSMNHLAHGGKKGMKWGYNDGERNGKRIAKGINDLIGVDKKKKKDDLLKEVEQAWNMSDQREKQYYDAQNKITEKYSKYRDPATYKLPPDKEREMRDELERMHEIYYTDYKIAYKKANAKGLEYQKAKHDYENTTLLGVSENIISSGKSFIDNLLKND